MFYKVRIDIFIIFLQFQLIILNYLQHYFGSNLFKNYVYNNIYFPHLDVILDCILGNRKRSLNPILVDKTLGAESHCRQNMDFWPVLLGFIQVRLCYVKDRRALQVQDRDQNRHRSVRTLSCFACFLLKLTNGALVVAMQQTGKHQNLFTKRKLIHIYISVYGFFRVEMS